MTTLSDVVVAEALLAARLVNKRGSVVKPRTGIGFDAHPLVEGRPMIVGGVEVPFDRGPMGHSDGDVLTHAVHRRHPWRARGSAT